MSGECFGCGEHTLECICNISGCMERGCRNLTTICKDCNRLICTKTFKCGDWISVKDRLPDYSLDVLITNGDDVEIGCLDMVGWICDYIYTPTHWMPLPTPPQDNPY